MSALKLAVSALGRDKPHSSITDWVDILTSSTYADETYDGIPELATSIRLQSTGPSEASRAIRKKIKHGTKHQQYRALVILHALMENSDRKFRIACMDDALVDALRQLASDAGADPKLRKKLLSVLAAWNTQFKDDPSLSAIAGLHSFSRALDRRSHARSESADAREAAKKRAKQEKEDAKERARKAAEQERRAKQRPRRPPFDFEAERPKILTAIATASQASINLANAIKLVNTARESIADNPHVQACLKDIKTARETIVRYTQLVDNEEVIGTLIETYDRIVSALQTYDDLSARPHTQDPTDGAQAAMNRMAITSGEPERAGTPPPQGQGETRNAAGYVHPDLQDLSFGGLGGEQAALPSPIRPVHRQDTSSDAVWDQHRGSLSDFSDYEGDEEAHPTGPSVGGRSGVGAAETEDPFADPFAD